MQGVWRVVCRIENLDVAGRYKSMLHIFKIEGVNVFLKKIELILIFNQFLCLIPKFKQ